MLSSNVRYLWFHETAREMSFNQKNHLEKTIMAFACFVAV
ncbi:hypothetical Protein YC6258_00456 [Gynuella sunshinyii YC6258]|uniref:Uncharacterized protein n=1 Tax=Gynuella sunshinyii YC6258 TaxID=1445510 RepID=A0A0C5VE64_9GAMM|nr:hypothetical Protein YC6258_00456 [Gynuella sunshinyii YC6258]